MADSGKPVKALENRPIILPGLDVYLEAYNNLYYDKPVGMDVGAIPWGSIIKWCELNQISDINDIETCVRYIRKMESVDHEIADRKRAKK